MKKSSIRFFSIFICLILLITIPVSAVGKEDRKMDDMLDIDKLPTKEVSVGYRVAQKTEIFGEADDEEIWQMIDQLMDILNSTKYQNNFVEVLSNGNSQKMNILEEADEELRALNIWKRDQKIDLSKLSVGIIDVSWSYEADENIDKKLDFSSNYVAPLSKDTEPFSDSLEYTVDGIFSNARYEVSASGSIFIPTRAPSIERSSGRHISGEYGGNGRPFVTRDDEMMTSFEFRQGGLIKRGAAYFYINSRGNIVQE